MSLRPARIAQEAVISGDQALRELLEARRAVFVHEHLVEKRSYRDIGEEVGLTKARVIQIIQQDNR